MNIFAEIGHVVLLPDAGLPAVEVRHRGRSIIARHAPDHPWSPSWVFIDPEPSHPHYYAHCGESDARLCWARPEEWSPTYHLIVAVGAAIRFLNEEVF
jgi:hypothetical protein